MKFASAFFVCLFCFHMGMKGLISVPSEPGCWVSACNKILQRMNHLFNFIPTFYRLLLLMYLYSRSSGFLMYSFIINPFTIVQTKYLSRSWTLQVQACIFGSLKRHQWLQCFGLLSSLYSAYYFRVLIRKNEALCFFCGAFLPNSLALRTITAGNWPVFSIKCLLKTVV